ncbi:unnamed protein product [Schistocephalus solidus]|uniref:Uncharacterized protein n=1 Tax=Schistocephalus solidus TaxID=70667 RepID=A0A3P7DA13_SCHSO|nr:unnamed protein product [Schistocephalus solidus]
MSILHRSFSTPPMSPLLPSLCRPLALSLVPSQF